MLTFLYVLGALFIAVLVLRVEAYRRRNLRKRARGQEWWASYPSYDGAGNPIDFDALDVPIIPHGSRIRSKGRLRILSTDRRRTFSRRWVNYRRTCIDDAPLPPLDYLAKRANSYDEAIVDRPCITYSKRVGRLHCPRPELSAALIGEEIEEVGITAREFIEGRNIPGLPK